MGGFGLIARAAHELALFAAAGFLIGGADDLLVDLGWIVLTVRRRWSGARGLSVEALPPPVPGRLALFVPAWREDAVIGAMVRTALARLGPSDWRVYVGTYPNDPATAAAARDAAAGDPRVRVVVGDHPGPTTKADNLNRMWQALLADEAAEGTRVRAVVLHDAEDEVHAQELAVYRALLGQADLVQIPVHAVPVRGHGRWAALVSSVYAGEFAEAHGRDLVLRGAIGAAVPSAGVGCAIARDVLAAAAQGRDGPFDPDTLTEDYELGLRVGQRGGRGVFVRVAAADGRGLVAVRACFPHELGASIRQKTRWVTGIAFAGWDRLGWSGGLAERWMRLRDRRAPLAALVLACGYAALLLWIGFRLAGRPIGLGLPSWLGRICLALFAWRVALRFGFTAREHGAPLALLAPLHLVLGNVAAILAAGRALLAYVGILRTGRVRWDKTAHVFPQ